MKMLTKDVLIKKKVDWKYGRKDNQFMLDKQTFQQNLQQKKLISYLKMFFFKILLIRYCFFFLFCSNWWWYFNQIIMDLFFGMKNWLITKLFYENSKHYRASILIKLSISKNDVVDWWGEWISVSEFDDDDETRIESIKMKLFF